MKKLIPYIIIMGCLALDDNSQKVYSSLKNREMKLEGAAGLSVVSKNDKEDSEGKNSTIKSNLQKNKLTDMCFELESASSDPALQSFLDIFNSAIYSKKCYFDDSVNKQVNAFIQKLTPAQLRQPIKNKFHSTNFLSLAIEYCGYSQIKLLLEKMCAQDFSFLYFQDSDGLNVLASLLYSVHSTYAKYSRNEADVFFRIAKDTLKVLLKYDEQNRLVAAVDKYNQTPLLFLLLFCTSIPEDKVFEFASMMIEKMSIVDLKVRNKKGRNALIGSGYGGYIRVMQLLLQKVLPVDKEYVNSVDDYNVTALLALFGGFKDDEFLTSEQQSVVVSLINAMSSKSLSVTPQDYFIALNNVILRLKDISSVVAPAVIRLIKNTDDIALRSSFSGSKVSFGCHAAQQLCNMSIDEEYEGEILSLIINRLALVDLIYTGPSYGTVLEGLLAYMATNESCSKKSIMMRLQLAQEVVKRMSKVNQETMEEICKEVLIGVSSSLSLEPAVYNPTMALSICESLYSLPNMDESFKAILKDIYAKWYAVINLTASGKKLLKIYGYLSTLAESVSSQLSSSTISTSTVSASA